MKYGRGGSFLVLIAALAWACAEPAADADMPDPGQAETPPAQPAAEMADPDPDIVPEGEATGVPAGFELRLDDDGADPAGVLVEETEGGLHVRTGPSTILYRPDGVVDAGAFSVSATFTEIGAPPNHREAFGILIGGQDLQGPDQSYAYFLMRADGMYLVKTRAGSTTANVTPGWAPSDAIDAAEAEEDIVNLLEVGLSDEMVRFLINGTEVYSGPAADLPTSGVVGMRINHNLNVQITDWTVTAGQP